jgi:hypothetical protein
MSKKAPTLRDVKRLAAKLGAIVEDEKSGNYHECRVEAPYRKVWKALDVHELVNSSYRPWKPDYADLIRLMNYGVEDCQYQHCDWCADNTATFGVIQKSSK